MILDDKNPLWIQTPISPAAVSRARRTATLTLNDNGTLEGTITEVLEGHQAEEWREINLARSTGERENAYRQSIVGRLPGAQISDIVLADPSDLTKPVSLHCNIKVEAYATRTGKRLIFAPAFFEMNTPARYTASERKNRVYIHYGWTETEDITMHTPAGFALDHADAPAPLAIRPFIDYSVKISAGKNLILYHRELLSADQGTNLQPQKHYPGVKQVFDAVHTADAHLLTLKTQTSRSRILMPGWLFPAAA